MTNDEIIKEYGKPENWISLSDLLDLARADEREKLSIEIDDLKSEIERLNGALESRKFIGG